MQEARTSLPPLEVIDRAKRFFVRNNSLYATFVELEGPEHLTLRGQGGEEIALGATAADGGTLVTASTYLFDMQVARFFATLPPLPAATTTAGAIDSTPESPGGAA